MNDIQLNENTHRRLSKQLMKINSNNEQNNKKSEKLEN